MPPKRAALIQNLRDSYTETSSFAVIEEWAAGTLQEIEGIAKAAAEAHGAIRNSTYGRAQAEKSPEQLLGVLQRYQDLCHNVYCQAETIRTVIAIRIPEHKEEDNLGVAVQHAVLKIIDELEIKTLGSGEKSGSGGAPTPIGMYALREYLSARSTVEDKLLGSVDAESGKTKGGSQSPSLLLELRQIDADFMLKVELATTHLSTMVRAVINAYLLNWKKLIQPRTGSDHMVS
ncbi:proteasome activator protein pa26, putative [Trypanosoma brucei gambiense DAL972]|uniref:Proteasome activator protein pa26, putative n=2 Tax=Trypanosoma brucei TaxID=5691 RepID=D0A282_TRYB9|nr:proteasome activator protein pa26, putative [Trypanosoma brucei gambiense DAL972]RHW68685.1 proteasome activator protein pa26 [Trypanosoma brucei equiperdum]CBH15376.1 proteasome activator protein pa26, putative [Trypanosoma brucei gambiense DAL972]|eukprot:XP_011777640.1 proteasome activator protein pa26, putative [Trypanosoma brucei gambiense DAL972]